MSIVSARRRVAWRSGLLLLGAIFAPAHHGAPPAQGQDSETPISSEASIEKALATPIDLDIDNERLDEAVRQVAAKAGIQIAIDETSLEAVDASIQDHATLKSKGLRLDSALDLCLRPLKLAFTIRDGSLVICNDDEAADLVRVYAVGDLINSPGAIGSSSPQRSQPPDFDSLIDTITSVIEPDTWDDAGGPGAISDQPGAAPANDALVVMNTWRVHKKIERLLADLRAVSLAPPAAPPASPDLVVRVYRLSSPEERADRGGATVPREPDEVGRLVQELVEPGRWKPGQVRVFKNVLVIRQAADVHARVLALLLEMGIMQPDPNLIGRMGGMGGAGGVVPLGGGMF
jgi:hypothetical protein